MACPGAQPLAYPLLLGIEEVFMKYAFYALAAVLFGAHAAQADFASFSVWQTAKQKTNSIEGKIKAIVVDEQERRIVLKVETDQAQVQTVKVCALDADNGFQTFEQSEKMALMRAAFAQGQRVHVSFNGPFDRCLSAIQYTSSNTATAQKASGESI
jgi:hypothetical protein